MTKNIHFIRVRGEKVETELTKEIKKAIRYFKPTMNSNMRTIRWGEEVNVGTGYVDSIRFEDYVKKDNSYCGRSYCKIDYNDNEFNSTKCSGCVYKRTEHVLGILTTCYEIKITKSDFKSKNGHNFVGNKNYYVIPKELYPQIIDLVEKDVGVILYYGNGNLRVKKECNFKEIDFETLSFFLFNTLKKWCDDFRRR